MLLDDIKARITQAMKDKDDVAKNILRLAFGEMQTAEARAGRALGEEEAVAIVRKLVKSNEETLAHAAGEQADALRKENAILTSLLPAAMPLEKIVEALAAQHDAIRAAKNDGQATGIAMKHLKSAGIDADGKAVGAAVKAIRA
jgi:uncharacterized protein YqeY